MGLHFALQASQWFFTYLVPLIWWLGPSLCKFTYVGQLGKENALRLPTFILCVVALTHIFPPMYPSFVEVNFPLFLSHTCQWKELAYLISWLLWPSLFPLSSVPSSSSYVSFLHTTSIRGYQRWPVKKVMLRTKFKRCVHYHELRLLFPRMFCTKQP